MVIKEKTRYVKMFTRSNRHKSSSGGPFIIVVMIVIIIVIIPPVWNRLRFRSGGGRFRVHQFHDRKGVLFTLSIRFDVFGV
jgi:membrane protein YdbS with pleckstrin-like domain